MKETKTTNPELIHLIGLLKERKQRKTSSHLAGRRRIT